MNYLVGIDPGAKGAMVVVNTKGELVKSIGLDSVVLNDMMKKHFPETIKVLVENVHAFPYAGRDGKVRQGNVSMFSFGYNFGNLMGRLEALEVEDKVEPVEPRTWQKMYEVPKGLEYQERKKYLKSKAHELFPNELITSQNADARLITHYLFTKWREENAKQFNTDVNSESTDTQLFI